MEHLQDIVYISEYIRSYGYWAPLAALFIFVLQAVIPMFPYAVLVAAAVIIFGPQSGFWIALLGATAGSLLCYKICCLCGVEWLNRKIMHYLGYDTSKVNDSIAFGGIVVAHLVQLVPNALINVAAALSRVPIGKFAVSTVLGLLPVTLAYTGVGLLFYYLEDAGKALLIISGLLILLWMGKKIAGKIWTRQQKTTVMGIAHEKAEPLCFEKPRDKQVKQYG